MYGDRESQTHHHSRGIGTQGLVDEIANPGKAHNLRIALFRLPAGETEQRGVNSHIFGARQIRMKTRAEFEQSRHSAFHRNRTGRRTAEAGQQVKQRALTCPVRPDDAEAFALIDAERQVGEG